MGPKTAELIDVLEELAILLESDGDNHWSRWMRKAKTLLQASDNPESPICALHTAEWARSMTSFLDKAAKAAFFPGSRDTKS